MELGGTINLYDRNQAFDDYTEDGRYEATRITRTRPRKRSLDRQAASDGDYYVKELSRSEGYELSIRKPEHPWTNAGRKARRVSAAESEGAGYAVVTKGLYSEQQVQSGAGRRIRGSGLSGTILSR